MIDSPITLTVSQVNECIKTIFDNAPYFNNLYVVGEISNFTHHYKTGHMYFTLKDDKSLIKAVIFKSSAINLKFIPENNMKVTVRGRITSFPRDGIYQIYIEDMEPMGIGALYIAYEQMKNKLEKEGLFLDIYKKEIPKFPNRIGIITSPKGAAIEDMKNIISRRYPLCEIVIFPATVQGPSAAKELISGLLYFENDPICDTVIIGRGGGSLEDLWSFNDENLARTIFSCEKPIISAVGHETDFTICDFVSDLRAPTPSAAAELAVPDINELKSFLHQMNINFNITIQSILNSYRNNLKFLSSNKFFTSPAFYFDDKKALLISIDQKISSEIENKINSKKNDLAKICEKMMALNPMAVLNRGYSTVTNSENKLISTVANIKIGENIFIHLKDGNVSSKVENIIRKENINDN